MGVCCSATLVPHESVKMSTSNHIKTWSPCEDILDNFETKNYAIVVLNCQINVKMDHRHILKLWSHAKVRVTVDGGTVRWLKWLEAHECEELEVPDPDLITGDMDSLPCEVLEYFESRNSKIIRTPDQDETDFTKALRELKTYCDGKDIQVDNVFVLADTSGRFDQIVANINTLFKAHSFMSNVKIYQISSNSFTWLLTPGSHIISIPQRLSEKQEWCALIPIGMPCIVTSTGLKWDLNKTKLYFGGMVSTSNTYRLGEPFVSVTTDGFLIWSMGTEAIL